MPHDLLLAGVFDLSGDAVPSEEVDRAVRALMPGLAGDVRSGPVPGGYLAARRYGVLARPPRIRAAEWHRHDDGSYVLLAGRIHDRDELCTAHGIDPSLDDAAIYASLHARLGEACDKAVVGDYAVIQWFPRERRLRLARSPISQYPVHLWRNCDRIAVSSLPRVLFALGAPSTVDDAKLADCLLLNLSQQSESWYRELERSHPGTVTEVDQAGRRSRRFWSIDDVRPVTLPHDEDYVEAVDAMFAKAVRATVADVSKPALFLSGGFDSQAVATYLVDVLPQGQRIPAYTSVPMPDYADAGGPHYFADESAHVRALAEMYPGIDPTFIVASDAPLDDRLDEVQMLGSWPIHNPMSLHWTNAALRAAAAEGCDAILQGTGGNATFSFAGETAYPGWLKQGRWVRLWRELALDGDPRPTWRKVISRAVKPHLSPRLQARWEALRGFPRADFPAWCALRPDFAQSSGALDRARAAGFDWQFSMFPSSRAWREDWLAVSTTEGAEMQTAFTLLHGVEQRDPTVYRPFMELCFGIPDDQYLCGGTRRWLARRLLKGRVPEMVRTERRYGTQNADWPARFARERAEVAAELASFARDERLAAIFDLERMRRGLETWEGAGPNQTAEAGDKWLAMARGIAAARFVRQAEGRNVR